MKNANILIVGIGKAFGGKELFIEKVCLELICKGYHFDFLVYYDISDYTRKKMEALGGKIYTVSRYSQNLFSFYKQVRLFYKLHPDYDIIHCHASHASMILYTFPVWFDGNKKIIFHSHSTNGNHKFLQQIMKIFVCSVVNERVACSRKAAKWMYGKKESRIIYNGIDAAIFRYDINKRNNLRGNLKLENNIVIGHVGRFEKQKNHFFLLEIFKAILKRNSKCRLLLIGDGELKDNIIKTITDSKIEKYIVILPFQDDIQNYYSMMDIFVLPSLFEGFPIVGVEAQASGLPCFFSETITREIAITDLAHFISEKSTADEWAEHILSCYDYKSEDREIYGDIIKEKMNIQNTFMEVDKVYQFCLSDLGKSNE